MDGWTTDDLDELPPDGRRRELIDGVLIVSPSPSNVHQIIAMRLGGALEAVCPPEFDVTLGVEIRDFDEFIEVDGPWAIKIPIAPLAPRYF